MYSTINKGESNTNESQIMACYWMKVCFAFGQLIINIGQKIGSHEGGRQGRIQRLF